MAAPETSGAAILHGSASQAEHIAPHHVSTANSSNMIDACQIGYPGRTTTLRELKIGATTPPKCALGQGSSLTLL
jgi:hypothetical protein